MAETRCLSDSHCETLSFLSLVQSYKIARYLQRMQAEAIPVVRHCLLAYLFHHISTHAYSTMNGPVHLV